MNQAWILINGQAQFWAFLDASQPLGAIVSDQHQAYRFDSEQHAQGKARELHSAGSKGWFPSRAIIDERTGGLGGLNLNW